MGIVQEALEADRKRQERERREGKQGETGGAANGVETALEAADKDLPPQRRSFGPKIPEEPPAAPPAEPPAAPPPEDPERRMVEKPKGILGGFTEGIHGWRKHSVRVGTEKPHEEPPAPPASEPPVQAPTGYSEDDLRRARNEGFLAGEKVGSAKGKTIGYNEARDESRKEIDKLKGKIDDLKKRKGVAEKEGDTAEVERLKHEIEVLQRKAGFREGTIEALNAILEAKPSDRRRELDYFYEKGNISIERYQKWRDLLGPSEPEARQPGGRESRFDSSYLASLPPLERALEMGKLELQGDSEHGEFLTLTIETFAQYLDALQSQSLDEMGLDLPKVKGKAEAVAENLKGLRTSYIKKEKVLGERLKAIADREKKRHANISYETQKDLVKLLGKDIDSFKAVAEEISDLKADMVLKLEELYGLLRMDKKINVINSAIGSYTTNETGTLDALKAYADTLKESAGLGKKDGMKSGEARRLLLFVTDRGTDIGVSQLSVAAKQLFDAVEIYNSLELGTDVYDRFIEDDKGNITLTPPKPLHATIGNLDEHTQVYNTVANVQKRATYISDRISGLAEYSGKLGNIFDARERMKFTGILTSKLEELRKGRGAAGTGTGAGA